jgi:hypothetical protein
MSVPQMAAAFREFHVGKRNAEYMAKPSQKTEKGMPKPPLILGFRVCQKLHVCQGLSGSVRVCQVIRSAGVA